MDRGDFFHKATLSICGNLEIEDALVSSLKLLKQVMPVSLMALDCYDKAFNSMRTIAIASPEEGKKVDILTPLSVGAREETESKYINDLQKGYVFEDPQKDKVAQEMLRLHGINDATSLLVLFLESGDQMIGALVLISVDERKFTQEHADLLLLLREPFSIAMSNALKHREVTQLKNLLADDNRYLQGELHRLSGDKIVGANFGLKDVMYKVHQVAALDSPVLLLGETGVGKDVIANAIHYSSSRSDGPYVSVNCGAIPETLVDSELFGHEKGAFTGALKQKRGRFERAHNGTIFLDEIGELQLQAQVRLLKVLQNREIERVGGVKTLKLNIRVIAATNRNLEDMIANNFFREDLWFRLNVFPIWIPPLRDRRMDIPALLQHFIKLKAGELKLQAFPSLSPGAIDLLTGYHWPGNVRELENVVERALILNAIGPLSYEDFNLKLPNNVKKAQGLDEETDKLDDVIFRHIRRVLMKTEGKVNGPGGAAELLGVNPSTLRSRMEKMGIKFGRKANQSDH